MRGREEKGEGGVRREAGFSPAYYLAPPLYRGTPDMELINPDHTIEMHMFNSYNCV
jgi:hypothetical protein